MSPDASNIRVFVRWNDSPTVFAGEELRCTICFKNVAQAGAVPTQQQLKPPQHVQRQTASLHGPSRLAPPPSSRNHRPSFSLSVPGHSRAGSIPWSPSHHPDSQSSNGNGHRRSISVVSIGSTNSIDSQATSNAGSTVSRPGRGHGRSSSLQIVSRGPVMNGPRSGW